MKTRLDPVVRLEENREETRLLALARANRRVNDAEEALARARANAQVDHRVRGTAVDWQIADIAHSRALSDVALAQNDLTKASDVALESRSHYIAQRARAESLRRVANARREETVRELDKREVKEQEDLQITRFRPTRAA